MQTSLGLMHVQQTFLCSILSHQSLGQIAKNRVHAMFLCLWLLIGHRNFNPVGYQVALGGWGAVLEGPEFPWETPMFSSSDELQDW